ncbi:MAG: T9SS type A sorting domain-containing protein, partial [Chitinophagaceae bacterium]|nr:T9SS type A sorting domain-containing protein [Chitinophagaceae bacterium]
YPVPANTQLTIVIRSKENRKADLQIFDAMGRVVKLQTTNLINGTNNIVIDVSGLPAGTYYLRSRGLLKDFNNKITIMH